VCDARIIRALARIVLLIFGLIDIHDGGKRERDRKAQRWEEEE
jgi:hypothetical protein